MKMTDLGALAEQYAADNVLRLTEPDSLNATLVVVGPGEDDVCPVELKREGDEQTHEVFIRRTLREILRQRKAIAACLFFLVEMSPTVTGTIEDGRAMTSSTHRASLDLERLRLELFDGTRTNVYFADVVRDRSVVLGEWVLWQGMIESGPYSMALSKAWPSETP